MDSEVESLHKKHRNAENRGVAYRPSDARKKSSRTYPPQGVTTLRRILARFLDPRITAPPRYS